MKTRRLPGAALARKSNVALTPQIRPLKATEIAKEMLEKKIPVKEVILMKGILSKEEADRLLKIEKLL